MKRLRLYQSQFESPAVKWIELVLLLAMAFCGMAGLAMLIAMAGAPTFAVLLILAGFGFAIWAWCDVYVEVADED